jgi:hypothetical protein
MLLKHHHLVIELPDVWIAEAGAEKFVPAGDSFRVDRSKAHETPFIIHITQIAPVERNPGVAIFNDNELATGRQRVVSILRGFCANSALPPIEVVKSRFGPYPYKLTAGVHRLYCSLAAGFTHVPAVTGFDMSDPHA